MRFEKWIIGLVQFNQSQNNATAANVPFLMIIKRIDEAQNHLPPAPPRLGEIHATNYCLLQHPIREKANKFIVSFRIWNINVIIIELLCYIAACLLSARVHNLQIDFNTNVNFFFLSKKTIIIYLSNWFQEILCIW